MKLLLLRGLPGSGKTTEANRIISENTDTKWKHYEADMYFEKNGVYTFDATKLSKAHEWCQLSTTIALAEGCNVIVSNTFTTRREISAYEIIAKDLGAVFEVKEIKGTYQSIHNVPEETLNKMKQRWQVWQ